MNCIIGIAGGTASGKTTLARELQQHFGETNSTVITVDSYYRPLDHLTPEEREVKNFDHPEILEFELLLKHLVDLRAGKTVAIPEYDFTRHTRSTNSFLVAPRPVVIIEGILSFHNPELRNLFDFKIFVDLDAPTRFIRRKARDIAERGRTEESVLRQWNATVQPTHEQFCEPTREFADVIVRGEVIDTATVQIILQKLHSGQHELSKI